MAKEVSAFLWSEGLNDATDLPHQAWNSVLGGLAQMGLQFAERHLNWVEVGRIGRQILRCCSRRFDRLLDAGDFVYRQVVHRDNFTALECGNEELLYPGEKHRPIHRPLKHARRGHPVQTKPRHKGDCLPMAVRRVADQSLTARTAAAKPHHHGIRAGLIDKHQFRGVEQALLAHPAAAGAGHLGALLLRRVQSFF